MLQLTQNELNFLEEVAAFPATENTFFTCNANKSVLKSVAEKQLVYTQRVGINANVALSDLGLGVVNNTVDHEILLKDDKYGPVTCIEVEEQIPGNPFVPVAFAPDVETETCVQVSPKTKRQVVVGDFELSFDFPMPTKAITSRGDTYPLHIMEIGQSFAVDYDGEKEITKERKRIQQNIANHKRKLEMLGHSVKSRKFAVHLTDKEEMRVWRVA